MQDIFINDELQSLNRYIKSVLKPSETLS